jgi:hypothetical protein
VIANDVETWRAASPLCETIIEININTNEKDILFCSNLFVFILLRKKERNKGSGRAGEHDQSNNKGRNACL